MPATATLAEVSKDFGVYEDSATRQPVIITRDGRPRTVLIAYENFVRLSLRDRRVELTTDLNEEEIDAVERAVMAPEHHGLDSGTGPFAAD